MRTRTFAAAFALLAAVLAGQTVAAPAAHAGIPPTWQKYKNYNSNLCLNVEELYQNYYPAFQDTCSSSISWRLNYITTNTNGTPIYTIENGGRGCLEYTGDIGTSSDARIYTCVASGSRTRQLWWLAGPNGKVTIRTVNKDMNGRHLCLEIEDSGTLRFDWAQLWTCSGQAGSFWNFQYRAT